MQPCWCEGCVVALDEGGVVVASGTEKAKLLPSVREDEGEKRCSEIRN